MAISPELKRIYASAPTDAVYVQTLQLSHSAFPATFWLNNSLRPWTFEISSGVPVLFSPIPFKVVLPTIDGKGQQDLQLAIDNVGQDAMAALESAISNPRESILVVLRVYLNVENSLPQNDPPLILSLSEVEISKEAITGTATRADTLNRPFPSMVYRTDNFPGLDR